MALAESKPGGENFALSAEAVMHPLMQKQNQPKTMPPIMRHVLPDEPNLNEMPSNFHPVKIAHAVTLFTDPHSHDLTKRHLHILQKIVTEYGDGFYLRDLVDILIIVNACADRCVEDSRYVRPMIEMIKIAEKPFKKEKLSDDVAYKGVLKDSYAQLGFLLRIDNEELQLQICHTLLAIYLGTAAPPTQQSKPKHGKEESETVRNAPDEPQRVPVEYSRYMLELSGVADTLVKALTLLQSPLVINVIFQILRHLTTQSSVNCDLVVKSGGAFAICVRMPTVEQDIDRGLYLATEILWNLMEYGDSKAVTRQIANQTCMRALQDTFAQQVPKTYSQHYRTVRNDLLAIINLIAKTDPLAPFIEVGLARTILTLFSFTETRNIYSLTKHLRFSESEEDFEFKRMLLAVIMNLSENPSVTPLMKEFKLLPAMFYYVSPVPQKDITWLPSQFEEIQLQCLASIPKVLPQLLEELVEIGGLETLSQFLEWCLAPSDQDYKGHGNSVYANGGRGSKLAQAKYTLRILKRIISFGEKSIIEGLLAAGLLEIYLKELNRLTDVMDQTVVHDFTPQTNSVAPDAFISLDITCEILYTMASLMETNNERKDNLGQEAVQLLTKIIQLDSKKVCLGLGYTRLLLAALETIWCCVCGSYTNECYFLEQEGAFVMLDLLEVQMNNSRNRHAGKGKNGQADSLKSVILGCLLDLLENPKSLHHVISWTGKMELKLGKLLIILWQQDSAENPDALKSAESNDESAMFIQDTDNPLQRALDQNTPRLSNEMSYSISQVGLDLKPKILGILTKIGFSELPGLVPTDYIWLASIERHFDFKISEVWKEITEELRQESLSPIGQDKQALEAISRISRDRAEATLTYQKSLHDAFEQQERADEHLIYSEIKAMRKQQEKLKTDFNAYVDRTSNFLSLKKAKQEQVVSIENSRIDSSVLKHPFFHVTSIANLNTTVFASQQVTSDNLPILPEDQKPSNKNPQPATASSKRAFFNPESEKI